MHTRCPALLCSFLLVAWLAPAGAAEPEKSEALERAGQLEIRNGKVAAEATEAEKQAKEAFEEAEKRREEAEARRRAGRVGTTVPEAPSAASSRRETPDPGALREQYRSSFPVAPPAQDTSPYAPTDPSKARAEALQRARQRATGALGEETVKTPDPLDRTLPARSGLPGATGGEAESLKGIARGLPGSGGPTNPYDAASVARGRPFFRLQHQAGGEGMWRCVKNCAQNGFQLDELTDTAGLPANAVRDDVNDMTTTEKLCQDNRKLCEEAGRSDRRPGEDDEAYWDRKAKEAYAARQERERKKRQETANADCSKKQTRTERESCEFDKKRAQEDIERERQQKEREQAERDEKKKDDGKQKDCMLAGGEDCDGLPDDELVGWHKAQQERLLGATGAGRAAGPGNIDPERGPAWRAGFDARAVEFYGVSDPPEDEGQPVGQAPEGDCTTAPGTGTIDYGPEHLGGGKPGCETETPSFDAQETLDLENASEEDDAEGDSAP